MKNNNIIDKIILFFNLDKKMKKMIIEEGLGTPIKLINKETNSYYSCPKNSPIEYCNKKNIIETKFFLTDMNNEVKIIEQFIGINFEASCDKYICKIEKVV